MISELNTAVQAGSGAARGGLCAVGTAVLWCPSQTHYDGCCWVGPIPQMAECQLNAIPGVPEPWRRGTEGHGLCWVDDLTW